ncbi:hypothetical protein AHF37_08257 [Paragonimus kellicotti]|nr:hypothetical protein AHF37_08257 [Paragonimus kellicotti]
MVSPATSGLLRKAEVTSLRLHPVTPSGVRQRIPLVGSSADLPTGRLCAHEQKSGITKTTAHKRKFDQAFCNARPKSPKVTTSPHVQNVLASVLIPALPIARLAGFLDFEFLDAAPAEVPLNGFRRKGFSSLSSSTASDPSGLRSQKCIRTRRYDDFESTRSYHRYAYSPPYHAQHRRRQNLQQTDVTNLRAYRVERRKAKSRVAAQVRPQPRRAKPDATSERVADLQRGA